MTNICVPSSRPLENRKADVLRKVGRALGDSEAQPMLVGAFARDVWFWHLNGIETGRATEDIDISMARLAGPATQSEIVSRLRSEISSQSNCPLAQELTRVTRGNFQKARDLLRDLLSGYEAS